MTCQTLLKENVQNAALAQLSVFVSYVQTRVSLCVCERQKAIDTQRGKMTRENEREKEKTQTKEKSEAQ